jgi:ribonuclease VapC
VDGRRLGLVIAGCLNFGDCFTYALAEQTGYPVLCTGDDFAVTGIPVLRPPAGNEKP